MKKNNTLASKKEFEIKITPFYQDKKTLQEMRDFFENEGFIQLTEFLDVKEIKKLMPIIKKQNFVHTYKPMFYKKKELNTKELYTLEIIKLLEYLKSKEFIEYIEKITELELQLYKFEMNIYEHTDYIILNDNAQKEESIEVIFDISDNFQKDSGAILTYATKDEELIYLEPDFNTLTILFKPEDVRKYLKYINKNAKNNQIIRIEISFTILEELQ